MASAAYPIPAPARDLAAPMMTAGAAGVATPSIARTIPAPYPYRKPVAVEYRLEAALPSWEATGNVLQPINSLPDPEAASAFVQNAGLPATVLNSKAAVTSLNIQWNDTDNYQWNFMADVPSISFTTLATYTEPSTRLPANKTDTQRALHAANTFLEGHGFSSIVASGGVIDESSFAYPCPMMDAAGGSSGSAALDAAVSNVAPPAKPSIMPYPCGGWSSYVSVLYGGTREGKRVVEVDGSPFRGTSLQVDTEAYHVTSGLIQLDQNMDRSSYALIDQNRAKAQLQSGGLNPVWPWGSERNTIIVHLTKIEQVWMHYASWHDGQNTTYYIPALLASGTVDRGMQLTKGSSAETYTALVPLLTDDAFEPLNNQSIPPTPVPLPAIQGGMPIKGAPEGQTAPTGGVTAPNIY